MSGPVFLSSQMTAGPVALATLRLIERASLRPKTATVPIFALGGLGLCYSLNMLPPREKDPSRRNKRHVLWDFYDPKGHHEIQWN